MLKLGNNIRLAWLGLITVLIIQLGLYSVQAQANQSRHQFSVETSDGLMIFETPLNHFSAFIPQKLQAIQLGNEDLDLNDSNSLIYFIQALNHDGQVMGDVGHVEVTLANPQSYQVAEIYQYDYELQEKVPLIYQASSEEIQFLMESAGTFVIHFDSGDQGEHLLTGSDNMYVSSEAHDSSVKLVFILLVCVALIVMVYYLPRKEWGKYFDR